MYTKKWLPSLLGVNVSLYLTSLSNYLLSRVVDLLVF
jgi:hypothetical protein